MSYDFLVKKFLSKKIEVEEIFDLNLDYLLTLDTNTEDTKKNKKKVEMIKVDGEIYDISKLKDIVTYYAKQKKFLLAFPSAHNFISNRATLIGSIKKEGNDMLELLFENIKNTDNLKDKIWDNLTKPDKRNKKYRGGHGICIVCGKETEVIPINKFVSASTITNPFNFEFGNYKKFSYGLCKEHVDRVLWFYLLDIWNLDIWNKATPNAKAGGYFLKILLYLEDCNSKCLLNINRKFYENDFNLENLVGSLDKIKEELQLRTYKGNLFIILYKIATNKAVVFRVYTIYNIDDWLKFAKELLKKIKIDNILKFVSKNVELKDKAVLEVFDVIFQRKKLDKLILLKKYLYNYFRSMYFNVKNKKLGNQDRKHLNNAIGISEIMVSEKYSLLETAGYIVGLVDRWYSINNYNTRIGQLVFSKRAPSIKDIKLAVAEALRRLGIREDLKASVLERVENIDSIKRILEDLQDENIRDINIGLAFSIGYFEAIYKKETK